MSTNDRLMTGDATLRERVLKTVTEIVAEHAGMAAEDIQERHSLENDLGLDSLGQVEIVMEIEDQLDVDIPDSITEEVRTVGDIVERVIDL